ncbi:MAG: phospho-N-acetylmuramoyl-pentapeptide-transferase, partial [Acetivibrio ethanolgignens]
MESVNYQVVMPVLIAFAVSVVLCPIFIPFLKKLKFGQFVRDDGPEAHLKKTGTPTMGGIIILSSILITSLIYIRGNKAILPVLFVTLGFGVIGFLDDYI